LKEVYQLLINGLNYFDTFTLIAGPCQLETKQHALDMAGTLKEICDSLDIRLIYKTSYDKANRTSLNSKRGSGMELAKDVFHAIVNTYNVPVLCDVHSVCQVWEMAAYIDVIQIPAFLCRQTDLLVAAAQTGRVVNVKKGQFLSPWDVTHILHKLEANGSERNLITERGTTFGYNNLVVDMRSIPIMKKQGAKVIFDATHSVQRPGGLGGTSGGDRQYVQTLATAAVAIGVDGLFMETHEDPDNAPSDGPNMIPLADMKSLLERLLEFDRIARK
jgi:2-dehydro-3-deoxyphosphooctonate aldolase (KDO 8-P synthase)